MELQEASETARQLIAGEVTLQNRMWGDANDRADITKGQLLEAAMAQCGAISLLQGLTEGEPHSSSDREWAFNAAKADFFPEDWGGFRDYGSDIANLVVAAAYIENEIKRRLLDGESTYRAPRKPEQVYDGSCKPNPV